MSRPVVPLLLCLLLIHLGLSVFFVTQRDIDRDEGFYMESAALISTGHYPYRDFMFSQMPLTAFLLWVVHSLFGNALLFGRLFMVLCLSLLHLFLFLFVIDRTGDKKTAAALTAISFTSVMYADWCIVVKSYPPALLFSLGGFLAFLQGLKLERDRSHGLWWFFWAGLLLSAAVNTRLVLAPLALTAALVLIVFSIKQKRWWGLLPFIGGALISSGPYLWLCILDLKRSIFFVLLWHLRRSSHQELGGWESAYSALHQFVLWPQHTILLLLVVVSIFLVYLLKRTTIIQTEASADYKFIYFLKNEYTLIVSAFLLIFVVNIIPNPVHFQYFSIVSPFLLLSALPALHRGVNNRSKVIKIITWSLVVLYVLFLSPRLYEWGRSAVEKPWQSSYNLRNLERVTNLLNNITSPEAVIHSSWPGYAYETGRNVLPRWEMGAFSFSYLPYYSLEEARYYHMAYNYNLPALVREGVVEAVVCGIDTIPNDITYLRALNLMTYRIGETEIFIIPRK